VTLAPPDPVVAGVIERGEPAAVIAALRGWRRPAGPGPLGAQQILD
jgi:hypothetical protein